VWKSQVPARFLLCLNFFKRRRAPEEQVACGVFGHKLSAVNVEGNLGGRRVSPKAGVPD
jgi:hypothetical protein